MTARKFHQDTQPLDHLAPHREKLREADIKLHGWQKIFGMENPGDKVIDLAFHLAPGVEDKCKIIIEVCSKLEGSRPYQTINRLIGKLVKSHPAEIKELEAKLDEARNNALENIRKEQNSLALQIEILNIKRSLLDRITESRFGTKPEKSRS